VKKLALRAAALAISSAVTLLLMEGLLRLAAPQQETMRWFSSNERYGFVNKPNFEQDYHYVGHDFVMQVRTNSLGLRDDEHDLAADQRKRVLLAGDSYVFGYAVQAEDTFDSKLETALNQDRREWMVINAGHGGWGTYQAALFTEDHLKSFRPDVVVLTFCANDPTDDEAFLGGSHDSEKGVFYFPGKIFIRDHSHVYRFIFYNYKKIANSWSIKNRVADAEEKDGAYVDPQSNSVITEAMWKRTLTRIRELHDKLRKFNPRAVLLVQSFDPLSDNIKQHLTSIANDKDLVYVDFAEGTQKLAPEARVLPWDGHWSPAMHELSARALHATLRELELD
jgi:lysophospholipase L1-like esterase